MCFNSKMIHKYLKKFALFFCSRLGNIELSQMGVYGEALFIFKSCLNAHIGNHIPSPSSKCDQTVMIPLIKLLHGSNTIKTG